MPIGGREFGSKEEVREFIWNAFVREGIWKYPPPRGRIPNFRGAELAAQKLSMLSFFKSAKVVFVAPDSPLLPVRQISLKAGKKLVVPLPHLTDIVEIDRSASRVRWGVTIRGIRSFGKHWKGERVDLVVQGAVAVDLKGWRIGKGKGYGDLEISLLRLRGFLDEGTPIVAVVHERQIFDDLSHLASPNDERVTHIVTPRGVRETEYWLQLRSPRSPP